MSVPFDSSSVCFSMTFDTASYTSSIQVGGGAPVEVEENSVPCVEIPFGKIDITIAVTSRQLGFRFLHHRIVSQGSAVSRIS